MVFPVVMHGCESWTIKKAEHQRIDALELWCWRRLESPLDFKEIKPINPKRNQSWIFIGRTHAEAETNTLATWCKDPKHWKRSWSWERLKVGGERDDRGWDAITNSMHMSLGKLWDLVTGTPGVLQFMGLQRVGHDWATEMNWTELMLWHLGFWWPWRDLPQD